MFINLVIQMRIQLLTILTIIITLTACEEATQGTKAPPIEMGDPSTIVTEADTQYLADIVPDLKFSNERPVTIASTEKDEEPTVDSIQSTIESLTQPAPSTAGSGLKVPFPQVTFFVPNIETKTYKEPNLETDYGASYELTEGSLFDNSITITGAEIENVYMRYQTIIVARNKLGTLPLESLRKLTDWEKQKGENGIYQIELDPKKLQGLKVSNKAIRNAVTRDAKSHNWTRNGISQWQKAVRSVKNSTQKPMHTELRSVMWKVTGKDANGRPFTRQLRIDVPIAP